MLFKLSKLNSNLALTLGYLNPALNNLALINDLWFTKTGILWLAVNLCRLLPAI